MLRLYHDLAFMFITPASSGLEQIDTFQDPGQLGDVNFDRCPAGRRSQPFKGAFLEFLIPDYKSGAIPEEDLTFITIPVKNTNRWPL